MAASHSSAIVVFRFDVLNFKSVSMEPEPCQSNKQQASLLKRVFANHNELAQPWACLHICGKAGTHVLE